MTNSITKSCLIRLFELESSLNYLVSSVKDARVVLLPTNEETELAIHLDCPVEAAEFIRKLKVIYRTCSQNMNVTWLTIHDKNFSVDYSEQDFILEFEDKDIFKKDSNMSTDLLEKINPSVIGSPNLFPQSSNYININGILYAPVVPVEPPKNGNNTTSLQEDRIARLEALMEKVIAAVSSREVEVEAPVTISAPEKEPASTTTNNAPQATEEKPAKISDKKLPRQIPRLVCYTSSTKMVREGLKSIDPTGSLHVDICDEILGKSKLGDKYLSALMIGFESYDSKKVSARQSALTKAIIEYRMKLLDFDNSPEQKSDAEESVEAPQE